MPVSKLLQKSSATPAQKVQLAMAKVLRGLFLKCETEGDVIQVANAAKDYTLNIANVMGQDGDFQGKRFSKAESNSIMHNATAFNTTVEIGNIPAAA